MYAYVYTYIYIYIYIYIMLRRQHGSPWPCPATPLYRLSLPGGLQTWNYLSVSDQIFDIKKNYVLDSKTSKNWTEYKYIINGV